MRFKNYEKSDYLAVCDFLVELNREDREHINWNWARFEWMIEHPEFDKSSSGSFGLWLDGDKIIGAAIYDMYFGEAFCAVLPEYSELYPKILEYAYADLKDDSGLGIAICDGNEKEIMAATKAGFSPAEQKEHIMKRDLTSPLRIDLPDGFTISELDHESDGPEVEWIVWQGFDHGSDREECQRQSVPPERVRPHFNKHLSLAAYTLDGVGAAYCCVWYRPDTDYAYVEPVCTVPEYRGKGIGKALVLEALSRAKALGAKCAYVISDQEFYKKLGFEPDRDFTFYWKNEK